MAEAVDTPAPVETTLLLFYRHKTNTKHKRLDTDVYLSLAASVSPTLAS